MYVHTLYCTTYFCKKMCDSFYKRDSWIFLSPCVYWHPFVFTPVSSSYTLLPQLYISPNKQQQQKENAFADKKTICHFHPLLSPIHGGRGRKRRNIKRPFILSRHPMASRMDRFSGSGQAKKRARAISFSACLGIRGLLLCSFFPPNA